MVVNSRYAKLIAVRKVTQENKGKNTAGVDGVKSLNKKQRMSLVNELEIDGKARPTRRVWIPKPGRKEKRPRLNPHHKRQSPTSITQISART